MDAPTPNTAAFLSYLNTLGAEGNVNATKDNAPSSLPPSAFFPIPGRDTPEDTPPSSVNTNQSPEKNFRDPLSAESDDEATPADAAKSRRQSTVNHKRKAGQGHQVNEDEDEDEDDSASDFATGHNDKRHNHNDKSAPGSGRKQAGRKSTGGDDNAPKGKEPSKAARRKEQNRAAQKAFRERREAKVRDLEEQVRELEAKSYGTSVENENLRGILKRLQEENVALRQAAFTFSMPVGNSTSPVNDNAPVQQQQQQQQQKQPPKSASPAQQPSPGDALRSINDPQPNVNGSSSRQSESPSNFISPTTSNFRSNSSDSTASSSINLFNGGDNAFNNAALGGIREMPNLPLVNAERQSTPSSVVSPDQNGRAELDALWASFLAQTPQRDQNQQQYNAAQNPYSLLNAQQGPVSFADTSAKFGNTQNQSNNWDKTAFRDTPNEEAQNQPPQITVKQESSTPRDNNPWSGANTSVDEFLASLTGANTDKDSYNDDNFDSQLRELLGANGASPSAMFNLPNNTNPFSPTNYLNMSPSPLNSISNGVSPRSVVTNATTASASATPDSSVNDTTSISTPEQREDSPALVCRLPTPGDSEPIYVVDDNGKVIKPSELWTRMGMPNESNVEHLIVDDLCAMMRAKATCKDGRKIVNAADAEKLFLYTGVDEEKEGRMRALEKRAGLPTGMFYPQDAKQV